MINYSIKALRRTFWRIDLWWRESRIKEPFNPRHSRKIDRALFELEKLEESK